MEIKIWNYVITSDGRQFIVQEMLTRVENSPKDAKVKYKKGDTYPGESYYYCTIESLFMGLFNLRAKQSKVRGGLVDFIRELKIFRDELKTALYPLIREG